MSDVVKFKCNSCGKKMGARAEYAGRKVRCPGCKEPVRVPSARPKQAATGAPVSVRSSRPASSGNSGSSMSLTDLAALEQQAPAQMAELTARPGARSSAPQVPGGKACPGCNASVKPEAVICVHCGHNFASGKRLKTKKDSKLGKAMASVSSAASEAQGKRNYNVASLWGLLMGGLFIVLGIGIMFYNWQPSSSSSTSRRGKWIVDLYESLGPTPTGCIVIGLGVIFLGGALMGNRE